MGQFTKFKEFLLDILFAPLCLNCRRNLRNEEKENGICKNCFEGIILNNSLFCSVCKARLPLNKKNCHKNSLYLLGAAANYDNEAVKNLIWAFKYKKWQKLQSLLGGLLLSYLKNLNIDFNEWTIVSIPLYKDKLKERGFNQSQLLAEIVAENLKLKLVTALKRIKNTEVQAGLKDEKQRKENVKGCFIVENPEIILKKNIILVDDVHTSGATMNEAVSVLRSAGAKKIIALVLAKAR